MEKDEAEPGDGEAVYLTDADGKILATGHYQRKGSIKLRILAFEEVKPNAAFYAERIANAFALRQKLGLATAAGTDCYRLIFGEGDRLPGLIIDIYGKVAVMQPHTAGMYRDRQQIVGALQQVLGDGLQGIYLKAKEAEMRKTESSWLMGDASALAPVQENGHTFAVDVEKGQKTGFFIDQRENRALLARYAKDKTVLNTFCYTGGFSIYAAKAGAKQVVSVDSSATAIALTEQNLQLNQLSSETHPAVTADVFDYLNEHAQKFEIIVLDPPAFAKNQHKRHNALMAYKRLNALAMKHLPPGGLLFTFSCSQVVDRQLFERTVISAAIEAGRSARILHRLSHPADHPVSAFHPEGEYLKGLVLEVE